MKEHVEYLESLCCIPEDKYGQPSKLHKASRWALDEIERLQDGLCRKFSFSPIKHKMDIFGICKRCKEGERSSQSKVKKR